MPVTLFSPVGWASSPSRLQKWDAPLVIGNYQIGYQYLIANRVEELGLGRWIKQRNISPMNLRKITQEVMQNNIIQNNVQQLGKTLQKAGGTEKAVEQIVKFKKTLNY